MDAAHLHDTTYYLNELAQIQDKQQEEEEKKERKLAEREIFKIPTNSKNRRKSTNSKNKGKPARKPRKTG